MTEDGGRRREPRRFVPPPWEREQFERLELGRRDEKTGGRVEPGDSAEGARAAPDPGPRDPRRSSDGPDPARVDAMLVALRAEEPAGTKGAGGFALAVSVGVGALGIILVIWGMVALARTAGGGPAGIMGALIMSMMGGVLTGLATWLGARGFKQRGERT